jgi:hypothetical protein
VREEERGRVRETQGVVLPLYRVEEEGEEAHKAVAASALRRPLMATAGAWCAAVSGRGRGRDGGVGGGALKEEGEEARGGRGGGVGVREGGGRWRKKGRGSWRLGTHLTGGPHLSARGSERRGRGTGAGPRVGRKWCRLQRGWWVGLAGKVCFFLFFQILFNTSFQHLLNSNLHTNFPTFFTTIFKTFHKYFKTFKTTPQPKTKTTKINATLSHIYLI